MELKREKKRAKADVIVADGETSETTDSADLLSDQSEITETTIPAPIKALEMSVAGAETILRPVSQTQILQTETLDYETEKLIIFSK